jgi:tryptophan synthase alpha chain
MNRLTRMATELKEQNKKAFVPYIMAGDGGMERLEELLLLFDKLGVSAVEVGIPFSDPVADGPTIQRAGKRALERGTTIEEILQTVQKVRSRIQTPIVFMTYLNPVLAYGKERFIAACKEAGVDGMIVPDLPYEEKDIIAPLLAQNNIALIPLVTLTSPKERIEKIVWDAEGFIYAVTVTGVTGARQSFQKQLHSFLQQVKEITPVPVFAGFGISTPAQIQEVASSCDGVIVGSKIIELLEQGREAEIAELVQAAKEPLYK